MSFSMSAIPAAFRVFHAGYEMTHAAAWKNAQLIGNLLIAGATLVRVFGVDLGVTDEQWTAMASGLAAVVNGVLTVATSSRVGIKGQPVDSVPPIVASRVDAPGVHVAPVQGNGNPSNSRMSARNDLPDLS